MYILWGIFKNTNKNKTFVSFIILFEKKSFVPKQKVMEVKNLASKKEKVA